MSEKKIFDPYYFETSVNQHNYLELLMTFYVKHHGVKDYKKYYFNKMVVHLFYKFGSTVIIHSHPKESGFGFWICNESFSNSFILSRTHSILKKNEKKMGLGLGFIPKIVWFWVLGFISNFWGGYETHTQNPNPYFFDCESMTVIIFQIYWQIYS